MKVVLFASTRTLSFDCTQNKHIRNLTPYIWGFVD